ncbi:hypothetical protein AV645_02030 [Acinetobacter calcoaceticus]|uniref:Uncharacterized protein n=1 Tax=Acinetobacter oleivorans TaxID=1148157 RepID=A0A0B2UBD1_9GAMM|nr:hypothetical protein DH17_01655 [Acinetobacter oleivorans]KUM12394.1 hypothetical protein AV645_02030 [Acinetobacter calcoaceticus]
MCSGLGTEHVDDRSFCMGTLYMNCGFKTKASSKLSNYYDVVRQAHYINWLFVIYKDKNLKLLFYMSKRIIVEQ